MGKRLARDSVLVAVLKNKSDLHILRTRMWYRIPIAQAPKRRFHFLAFYQPAGFGRLGKSIRYFARVSQITIHTRRKLFPKERAHPRADELYYKIRTGNLQKLPHAIKNKRFPARRISFGFTTLRRLFTSRNILQLYGINETEEILARALIQAKIPFIGQHYVGGIRQKKRVKYFLDFCILCHRGCIAIECDNDKAHQAEMQRIKDMAKDDFLRDRGWTVMRLRERDITAALPRTLALVQNNIERLGGTQN